jgi:GntR family transcriptional regulator
MTIESTGTPFRSPLYQKVFSVLRQRIVDGHLEPGEQLQTEDELAEEFNVSRATIRQAVGELVARRLVRRKQGKGTFVQPSADHMLGPRLTGSLTDVVPPGARIVSLDVARNVTLPPRVASRLALDDPSGCVIRRVRAMDGEVFGVTINYLPTWLGELVTDQQLRSESLLGLFEARGLHIGWGEQVIRSEIADVSVSGWLDIDFGSPVLVAERVLFDRRSQPLDVVQSWYRGDRYEYRVRLTAGSLSA